ncbi:RES family NAD+ phosphorylase [Parvibaculum sp.]|uniref:RES family NAD+ phosphorylase n=1 Tax=Parvibaculum sp. TaxID=2024848 RepID=UPI0034A0A06D
MTPLPAPLGGGELVVWRIDHARHASAWDSGEGAFRIGGRWNRRGRRAVYCAVDPATAILEVAVHKGFDALDTVPHILSAITISAPAGVRVVEPASIPDPGWLRPGIPDAAQQTFGDALLAENKFVAIPSVVSSHSWNLVFVAADAAGAYELKSQEPLILDPRLHSPAMR